MSAKSETKIELISCDQARLDIARFAGSQVPAAEARILRAHLLRCETCNGFYRESVETAAALGSNLRAGREELESEQVEMRRAAYKSLDKVKKSRPNHSALRTILLPAFFFFLMVFVTKAAWPGDKVTVKDWSGAVFLGQNPFPPGDPPGAIIRGGWLTTAERAELNLEAGDAEIRLEELTFLMVENAAAHRFRLRSGKLHVSGPCQVTTTFGVVEITDGKAKIEQSGSKLFVWCEEGEVLFVDALGKSLLRSGESVSRGVR